MTVKRVPEFLVDATNVYRTKGYIVKQQITLQMHKAVLHFLALLFAFHHLL